MIAAAHLDNFLFLIFFAVAILFQLLTRLAGKTGRRPGGDQKGRSTSSPQAPPWTSRQSEETEEDRVRKFLEALGQPTASKPPPPVATRPTYQKPIVLPHVGPFSSPLPPLKTRPPELSHEPEAPPRTALSQQRKRFVPKNAPAAFEVHQGPPPLAPITEAEVAAAFQSATAQPVSKSDARIDLATLLKSTSGLRDAIILREIFGPPRSLQPFDLVGNV